MNFGTCHVEGRFDKIDDIFFRVLEAWCHCDFRKMEALKVNKFGGTYRTGAQAAQAIELSLVHTCAISITQAT